MTGPTEPTVHPAPGGGSGAAVVVVNYGSSELVERCLAFADGLTDLRVVVVDNYSSSAELQLIRERSVANNWDLVEAAVNLGFGAAVDLGVRRGAELGARRFLLVNPDAEVDALAAEQLLAAVHGPSALVGPRIVDGEGANYFNGSQVGLRSGRIRSVAVVDAQSGVVESRLTEPGTDWITGACMAFNWELFQQLNGFGSDYFMYWEDVDFSYRAAISGTRPVVRRDITVVHVEGGTQGPARGRAKSNLYYRFNTRNRLLFAARNLDRRSILSWVLRTPAVSWEILLRGGRRQIIESPSTLLSAVQGSAAGLGFALVALLRRPNRVSAK